MHREHDLNDLNILFTITLFKIITAVANLTDTFSVILTLTFSFSKFIHDEVFNQLTLTSTEYSKLIHYLCNNTNMKVSFITSFSLSVLSFIIHSAADQVNITEKEEELMNMSDEKDLKSMNDFILLCICVNQLKAELLKKTHQTDEKITFLTVTNTCLNEVLLL